MKLRIHGFSLLLPLAIGAAWPAASFGQSCVSSYEESFDAGPGGWSSQGLGAMGDGVEPTGGWDGGPYFWAMRQGLYPVINATAGPAQLVLTGDLTATLGDLITVSYYGQTFVISGAGPTADRIYSIDGDGVALWRRWVPEGLGSWSHIEYSIDANWSDIEAEQAGWERFSVDDGTKSWSETLRNVSDFILYSGNCPTPCPITIVNETGIDGILITGEVSAKEVVRVGTPANPAAFLPGVTSGPVIGLIWDPVIDHTTFVPDATLDVCLVSFASENLPLPGAGTLLCSLFAAPIGFAAPTPGTPFSIPFPTGCSLVGLSIYTQGVSLHPLGYSFANAIDITVGSS